MPGGMLAFNHQVGTINLFNGTGKIEGLELGPSYSFGSSPASESNRTSRKVNHDTSVSTKKAPSNIRAHHSRQQSQSGQVPYNAPIYSFASRTSTVPQSASDPNGWLARASRSSFSRIDVRGRGEFEELAEYIETSPTARGRITHLTFEGNPGSSESLLIADTFASIVCSLSKVQSITLRRVYLHGHVDSQSCAPLQTTLRELCMDTVEPHSVAAICDILACVPYVTSLILKNVGDFSGFEAQCTGDSPLAAEHLQNLQVPQLQQLQSLELSSVCSVKFYLNLAQTTLSPETLLGLKRVVAECSQVEDVEALDDFLFHARGLEYLRLKLADCLGLGLPRGEHRELVKALMPNVARCTNLKGINITTFISLMEMEGNSLRWDCMCGALSFISNKAVHYVEIDFEVDTTQAGTSLGEVLVLLDWSLLRTALSRFTNSGIEAAVQLRLDTVLSEEDRQVIYQGLHDLNDAVYIVDESEHQDEMMQEDTD